MTTPSSKSSRVYARFIPSEEVGDVTHWKFGAVDGSEPVVEEAPEPAPPDPALIEAQHQQALDQARSDAFVQGQAQGHAQASLEWQQRLDDYIAQQGAEAAQRVDAIVQGLQLHMEQLQQGAAQGVLELACEIARQVLRQDLKSDPQALLPVVREALSMLSVDSSPATVRLNPQDHALLEAALQQKPTAQRVHWVADASVAPGGCQVEQAGMVIDGSLAKRWQRAIAPLGLSLPWEHQGDEHQE